MRSQQEFLVQQCKEPINGLLYTAGFHYSMIRFCAMHTVHLGIGLFANGGAFFELLKVRYFPGQDQAERFRVAFAMFKNFIKQHNIRCSQPQFKSWMFMSNGDEYCFFTAKVSRLTHAAVEFGYTGVGRAS